jgi:DNA-binding beta-propeller fold protein YncE
VLQLQGRVLSLILSAFLLAGGFFPSISASSLNGVNVVQWGSGGTGNGKFQQPQGVAVDDSGNVYVIDMDNNRIQKFTSGGTYVLKWGSEGSGNGQFQYPQAVAVDASGNVYVVDTGNSRIQKFTSSGTFLMKWGSGGSGDVEFQYPQGVAVDTSGFVYVVDSGNSRIQKFTSSGTFLMKWGGGGSGNGQFQYIQGVAVDGSGNVYVVDSGNSRIQKFTHNGIYVAQWGSEGSSNGQFSKPSGVAVDASGNIYVADYDNHRIQKFTPNGAYVAQWGSKGSGNEQFSYPSGIAVDTPGNVYVADSGNNRIQKFTRNAVFELSGLTINLLQVEVNKTVTISVNVQNTGDLSGEYTVDLKINGAVEASKKVTVAGGAQTNLSFEVSKAAPGTYTVAVGSQSGSFTVVNPPKPASFELSNLTINPTQVNVSQTVTVSLNVKNTGDLIGEYTVDLKINGFVEASKKVTVAGGAQVKVSFEVTKAITGIMPVAVGNLTSSFTVKLPLKPAAISVKTLQISKTIVKPNEEIEATVTLENTGELSGSYVLKLNLDGVEKSSSAISVDGGKTVNKTITLSSSVEGTHKVNTDGKSIEFEVKNESSGIDGFPLEAVFIGLMLAILLKRIPVQRYEKMRQL